MKNPGPSLMAFFRNPVAAYVLNGVVGVSLGYALFVTFPEYPFVWTMISTLIVLSPEDKNVNRIAFDRIKANLIGSGFGVLLFLAHRPTLVFLCAGLICITAICSFVKIMHAVRAALIAFLIVTVHQGGSHSWTVAAERMGCVIVGCVIAITVTFFFKWLFSRKLPANS